MQHFFLGSEADGIGKKINDILKEGIEQKSIVCDLFCSFLQRELDSSWLVCDDCITINLFQKKTTNARKKALLKMLQSVHPEEDLSGISHVLCIGTIPGHFFAVHFDLDASVMVIFDDWYKGDFYLVDTEYFSLLEKMKSIPNSIKGVKKWKPCKAIHSNHQHGDEKRCMISSLIFFVSVAFGKPKLIEDWNVEAMRHLVHAVCWFEATSVYSPFSKEMNQLKNINPYKAVFQRMEKPDIHSGLRPFSIQVGAMFLFSLFFFN